jgi:hypothetical protein
MTGTPDEMPTELADYAWVTPAEAWAMHDAIDANTGDRAGIVLGIRIGGRWGGIQLAPEVVSDMTIELGRWLTEYVRALDAQQDTDDA